MVCETVQKNLLFYIEGLYQPGKRAEIESHLATCEACQRVLEQERAFLLLLSSSLSIAPAPAQLKSRIKSALEQNRKVRVARKPWFWLCPVVTASLGIMISFAGLYFYNRSTHLDWVVGAHLAVSEDASLFDRTPTD